MSLFRAAAIVGGNTLVSRVLGFVRDVLTAQALGASGISDAFVVAQRLPNLFRTLFAEGAFSTAFVPVFAKKVADEGEAGAQAYAERALSVLLTVLLALIFLGEIFMPWVIPVIAFGFKARPEQLAFATDLTRITFPYLLFISLVALIGGILNSLGKFAAVAVTPALLNIFMIAGVLWGEHLGGVGPALSWAVTLSGVAQFLWLMVSCTRAGMSLRLPRPRLTPDIRRLFRLMAPGVFGAGVTQINLLVSTNVASLLPAGSMTYLYYADRLNQLPLGVVGIAVGTAILPQLSRQLRNHDDSAANVTQNRALELAFFLTLPAAAALGFLAEPILSALFVRGDFTPHAATETAKALTAYAVGLPALVAVKVLAPAFYARHDTRTPMWAAVVSLVTNLLLTITLSIPFAHVGNAIATTTAGWLNAGQLAWHLHRRGHLVLDDRFRRIFPRILAAVAVMVAVLLLVDAGLDPFLHQHGVLRYGALAALIAAGGGGYALGAVVTGAADWRQLLRMLKRA